MKRLFRIILGSALVVFPLCIGTYIWLWEDTESWSDSVGQLSWYLVSGQWDKLPE